MVTIPLAGICPQSIRAHWARLHEGVRKGEAAIRIADCPSKLGSRAPFAVLVFGRVSGRVGLLGWVLAWAAAQAAARFACRSGS